MQHVPGAEFRACRLALRGRPPRGLTEQPHWIISQVVKYDDSSLDKTFSALGNPTRRAILEQLSLEPGMSVSELAKPLSLKLPAMMKHLDVLSEAGLIARSKEGRTVSVSLATEPTAEAMRWLERHDKFWAASLDRLAAYTESQDAKIRKSK